MGVKNDDLAERVRKSAVLGKCAGSTWMQIVEPAGRPGRSR